MKIEKIICFVSFAIIMAFLTVKILTPQLYLSIEDFIGKGVMYISLVICVIAFIILSDKLTN